MGEVKADGKAEAATTMVDPGIANEERVFMTDAVMQAASARIEITEVKESQESSKNKGDVRYVTATLSLDGQRFTHDFALTQGKKEFGVLDNWQITEAFMLKVEVKAKGIPAVSIGDATKTLAKDEAFGSVEAVKTVSDLLMPVAGEVLEVNPELEDKPELVNSDPYGQGWLIKVKPADVAEVAGLLSADDYKNLIG